LHWQSVTACAPAAVVAELEGQKLIFVALLFLGQLWQIPAGYEPFNESKHELYDCASTNGIKNMKNTNM
jgi:hypothetical protein